ncbi:MAG: helix-turn-helix domain-containing protein [Salinigranum sp.]
MDVLFLYDFGVDLLSAVVLVYLLATERRFVGYRRFFFATTIGLFLFALAEPLSLWFPRWITHSVHGFGLLCIAGGMVKPVLHELHDDDWANMLVESPESLRPREEWMVPLDDEILKLFHSTDLVLTPALIAYNLEYSRGEVNRRLSTLEEHGYVERIARGKYYLSTDGEDYFHGTSRPAPAGEGPQAN